MPDTRQALLAGSSTTTSSEATAPVLGVGSGESATAFTLPASAGTVTPPVGADAIAAAGKALLALYWQPPAGMTYAGLADALEPYATPRFANSFRDPQRLGDPATGADGTTVTEFSVQVASSTADRAVIAGRAVVVGAHGSTIVWRNLNMVHGSDGAWRADSFT